jgi:hypothetical protein
MKIQCLTFPILLVQLLISNSLACKSQNKQNRANCVSINNAFKAGMSNYHSYLKSDTIYFENTINLQNNCLKKTGFKFSIIDFMYLDKDTSVFMKPRLVVGLNYYDFKLNFLRMGLHKIRFIQETGNWETVLQGNIEIYLDKRKRLGRIRKIVKNL